jgi:RAB protein geranylgeranyltransferase component A
VLANISVPVPIPESLLRDSRNYAISLAPSIVSSVGPLIDTLVNSGVSRYVKFKLLDGVGLYANASNGGAKSSGQEWAGSVKTVPGSKEDVFKSKELGLLQKRKLMKFLMATASQLEQSSENVTNSVDNLPFLKYLTSKEVGLDAEVANAVAYALSLSSDPNGEWYISTSSYSILSMSRSEPDIASKNQRDRPSSDSRNTYVLPADMEIHPF